jgi:hypothetical protein
MILLSRICGKHYNIVTRTFGGLDKPHFETPLIRVEYYSEEKNYRIFPPSGDFMPHAPFPPVCFSTPNDHTLNHHYFMGMPPKPPDSAKFIYAISY